MSNNQPQPKIFISYSWSTPEHQDWVVSLAHQLMADGINVVLDKWDLKEGQDKFSFMESMVTSPDIFRVLMICDERYALKADNRDGGVGAETQIITPQVYNKVGQEKFIPVVSQVNEEGHAYLPAYLKSIIYINLSSEENYTLEYEKLVRNIYNRPSLSKPKLGTPPSYLFEDSPVSYKITTMLRSMDAQLDKYPARVNLFVKDFLAEFDLNLLGFKIGAPGSTYVELGKQIMDKLTQYQPLRDDYLHFIDKLAKDDRNFDSDILIRFFEKLPLHLNAREEDEHSGRNAYYDHFKLINHELFIYTIAMALRHDNYYLLEDLLMAKYFFKNRYRDKVEPQNYDRLRGHLDHIDQYYSQLTGRRSDNAHTEVMMIRVPEFIRKDEFIAGDLLCYHIGQLNGVEWYPVTYGHSNRNRGDFEFFNRLISLKHFERVKNLLSATTVAEFRQHLTEIIAKGSEAGYGGYRGRLPSMEYYVKPEQVGTTK